MIVDPIGTLARITHHYRGAIVSVSLGPMKLIMPTTPHQVAHMYYDHWRKYPKGSGGFYKSVRRVFGDSVVTRDGDDWLADRLLLQPIFSQKNLDNLTGEMIASVKDSLDALTPRAAQGSPLAINREMKTLTINVLAQCIFGVSLTKDENGNLGTLATEIFEVMLKRMYVFFLPSVLRYAIHHDPALWERPESFEPERFEHSDSWPRGMYAPFGDGPRVCIGDRFSLLESQIVLALFLQRFRPRLAVSKAVRVRGIGVALKPVQDILMFCSPRGNHAG